MTQQSETSGAEGLLKLLRDQLALYRRLEQMSRGQRALVAQEDPQPLLALLSERQKVVDELVDLSRELAPIQKVFRDEPGMLGAEQRAAAESLHQQTGETLQNILDSDEEDGRLLAARKIQTAKRVQALVTSGQANAAYGMPGAATPQYSRTDESA